ncbi:helix-turn-helix domain-containing protein [Amycolatopsis sp. lyj-23]|uniref:helix-turn-helix domain-containing protein n=1 Tax=Amycolatopsis sp. lyj-23 TaxID=2789283 RepID=UPI00397A1B02
MRRVVPHDFWYRPDVAGHLSRFDLPAVLQAVTELPGWNQSQLASTLGYGQSGLGKIIRRDNALRLDTALQIVHELGIPPHLVGVGGEQEEVDPVDRRDFGRLAAATLASAAIGGPTSVQANTTPIPGTHAAETAAKIRALTEKYAALERKRGGNSIRQQLVREVSVLEPQVRAVGYPAAVAAFGELCGLTGYAHYDAQEHTLASHYYSLALQAAHQSEAHPLAGQVRALMSMRATWKDEGDEGASHCVTALETLPNLPAVERAMLMGRQARAEALKGAKQEVYRLIGTSRELMADAGPRRPLIAYWSDTEIYGNAGIAYKKVEDYPKAEIELRRAIEAAGVEDSRDRTLYLGMFSRMMVTLRRYEEAAASIDEILKSSVLSSRTTHQLHLFIKRAKDVHARPVDEVRYRIRERLSAGKV